MYALAAEGSAFRPDPFQNKFFFDTEFIEKRGSIQLISIGIVMEDGSTFYMENTDFNPFEADEWVIKNVIHKLSMNWWSSDCWRKFIPDRNAVSVETKADPKLILDFDWTRETQLIPKNTGNNFYGVANMAYIALHLDRFFKAYMERQVIERSTETYKPISFGEFKPYAYFADYDWVNLCWIFGRMIDKPDYLPMYCTDLKQMMDECGLDKEWKRKNHPDPENAHNALVDANWNKDLYFSIKRYCQEEYEKVLQIRRGS